MRSKTFIVKVLLSVFRGKDSCGVGMAETRDAAVSRVAMSEYCIFAFVLKSVTWMF